jgi:hypothetical protein
MRSLIIEVSHYKDEANGYSNLNLTLKLLRFSYKLDSLPYEGSMKC